jgi:hypothetical protein
MALPLSRRPSKLMRKCANDLAGTDSLTTPVGALDLPFFRGSGADAAALAVREADDSMASNPVLNISANSQTTRLGRRSSLDSIIFVIPTSTDMNARAETVSACEKSDLSSPKNCAPSVRLPRRERGSWFSATRRMTLASAVDVRTRCWQRAVESGAVDLQS